MINIYKFLLLKKVKVIDIHLSLFVKEVICDITFYNSKGWTHPWI